MFYIKTFILYVGAHVGVCVPWCVRVRVCAVREELVGVSHSFHFGTWRRSLGSRFADSTFTHLVKYTCFYDRT